MKTNFSKLLGAAAVCSAMGAATAQAGFFTGEFAPANWTFSGPPATIEWNPALPADPSSVTVSAPTGQSSLTTLDLNPISGLYTVSFRTTFDARSAPSASLLMNAPGYVGENLGTYPGDTMPSVKTYSFVMGPGDTLNFLMNADTSGVPDKPNVPFFKIDDWNVQLVPEPGQWAMMGVTALGAVGYMLRRHRAKASQ